MKSKLKIIYTLIATILIVVGLILGIKTYQAWQVRDDFTTSVEAFRAEFLATENENEIIELVNGEYHNLPDECLELMKYSIEPLKKINADIIGWIRIPGTVIDYVIMQGETNNTYIHSDMYGNYSGGGVPFLNCHNVIGRDRENYMVYGHHFSTGNVAFTPLTKYVDQEFYDKYPNFYVMIEGDIFECQIFSVYHTNTQSGYDTMYFETAEEKAEYLKWVIDESCIECKNIDVTGDDITITLSTCDKAFNGEHSRFAIAAKLVKIEIEHRYK